MSDSIIVNIEPANQKLAQLIEEVKGLDLSPLDEQLPNNELFKQCEARRRVINQKIKLLDLYIGLIESNNEKWLEFIQKVSTSMKKKEEEEKYATVIKEKGILTSLNSGKETVVALKLRQDDVEAILQELNRAQIKLPDPQQTSQTAQQAVNLPQLPLPTFSGDPRLWRQFWSGFEAAVHTHPIPVIQKLNYLLSCLRGEALLAVRGYDIAPENYEVIRDILINKFGKSPTIKKSLYKELESIKRNERDWKTTIETTEKVLRQLEALSENLEHSSIENIIETRLPKWIIDKVYQQKEEQKVWSVAKLRSFLGKSQEVARNQLSSSGKANNLDEGKPHKFTHNTRGKTSALVAFKQPSSKNQREGTTSKKIAIYKPGRPCTFCNKKHWDTDCQEYPTLKKRLECRGVNKACLNCLHKGHETKDCNKIKRKCFYCKGPHNSTLCHTKYDVQDARPSNQKSNPLTSANSMTQKSNQGAKEILLLCKEITVSNPKMPKIQEKALALFDCGSQLSFVSKNLANRLNLKGSEDEIRIASFSYKIPQPYFTTKMEIVARMGKTEVIRFEANTIDYLTNKLQVINLNDHDLASITDLDQLDCPKSYWKQPDTLIGSDHFFKFIEMGKAQNLKSGFSLLHTKLEPMLAGSGYITGIPVPDSDKTKLICVANVTVPDIDQFWKLEFIGIQEQPNAIDDEKALEHFKESISKHNGRYQVCWPWKEAKVKLGSNFGLCFGRLKTLIKRQQADERLLYQYDKTIQDQLHSEIIEEVHPDMDQAGMIHYLPHHEVITPHHTNL
ncbi:hypothetical protein ACH3XW_35875 [Acanthocheilonema viteae]